MIKHSVSLLVTVLFLFAAGSAFAQGRYRRPYPEQSIRPHEQSRRPAPDDFEWAVGELPPGTDIVVKKHDGNWVRGRIVGVYPDGLTLKHHRDLLDIPRDEIYRVALPGSNHAEAGGEIGAGAGMIVGALGAGKWGFEGIVGGFLIGYVTGAIVGSQHYDKDYIYEDDGRDYSAAPFRSGDAILPQAHDRHTDCGKPSLQLPVRITDPSTVFSRLTYDPAHGLFPARSPEQWP